MKSKKVAWWSKMQSLVGWKKKDQWVREQISRSGRLQSKLIVMQADSSWI